MESKDEIQIMRKKNVSGEVFLKKQKKPTAIWLPLLKVKSVLKWGIHHLY